MLLHLGVRIRAGLRHARRASQAGGVLPAGGLLIASGRSSGLPGSRSRGSEARCHNVRTSRRTRWISGQPLAALLGTRSLLLRSSFGSSREHVRRGGAFRVVDLAWATEPRRFGPCVLIEARAPRPRRPYVPGRAPVTQASRCPRELRELRQGLGRLADSPISPSRGDQEPLVYQTSPQQ
jgi:hypothetical protein